MGFSELKTTVQAVPEADSYANYLLCLALDIGEQILRSGGEINRVEDTIERVCRAYGAIHVEVFAIPSLIIASVRMADNGYSSQMRRVYATENHLSNLEGFNAISRMICRETPPLEEVDEMIKAEKKKKKSALLAMFISYAAVAGFFTILFGGSLVDSLCSMTVAMLLVPILLIKPIYLNQLAKTLITSILAGVLSYVCVMIGLGQHVDMIIIGTIMVQIPGLAFGNAMRDLLCGDIVAGILRTVQSCITAILIACGYALSMFALSPYLPVSGETVANLHPIFEWVAALFGTLGFAGMVRTRAKHFPVLAILSVLMYGIYKGVLSLPASFFWAAFLAAAFVTLSGDLLARLLRTPTVIYLINAPIVIVPGASLYYTMNALLMENQAQLDIHLERMLQISIGMAAGIVSISILLQSLWRLAYQIKHRREDSDQSDRS